MLLRAINVHAMRTMSLEVLEKRREAASKSSSDKKLLSAVTIPNALSRTSESDDDDDNVDGPGTPSQSSEPEGIDSESIDKGSTSMEVAVTSNDFSMTSAR